MIFKKWKCPKHGHSYVSMPRQERDGAESYIQDNVSDHCDERFVAKCPLNFCGHGIKRPCVIDSQIRLSLDIGEASNGQN
jgi:hypothetical protein